MKKIGPYIFVVVWIICCSGCTDISHWEKDDMTCKISKSEAIDIAWDALKNTEPEIAHRYHIKDVYCHQGSWDILFRGDPSVLGDHFSVIVAEDKTVKVLPGE